MKNNLHKIIAFIVPLTAMLIVCRAFPVLSFLYYAVPIILVLTPVLYLLKRKNFQPDKKLKIAISLLIAFAVWAAITSVWSAYPEVSLTRTAYFVLISVSPLLLGYLWRQYNINDLFGFLLPANILVAAVSLYSLITSSPPEAWTGGHALGFMGYAGHQNTLASALVFTIPAVLYPLLREFAGKVWNVYKGSAGFKKMPASKIIFLLTLLALNLFLIVISVSRGAVLTLILMILVYVMLGFNFKTSAGIILLFTSVLVVLFYTSRPVNEFTFKTENTIGDRRKINIKETIEAAKNGGLTGIGYGISRTPPDSLTLGRIRGDDKRFDREKMISSLALVEETGIIGLLLFILPVIYVLNLLAKRYYAALKEKGINKFILRSDTSIVISVLIALIFHAQIEGWWVGVGSIHLPLFYLVMSSE